MTITRVVTKVVTFLVHTREKKAHFPCFFLQLLPQQVACRVVLAQIIFRMPFLTQPFPISWSEIGTVWLGNR